MADAKEKKDEKKPDEKGHGVVLPQSFADWAVHQTMSALLPWLFGKGRDLVEGKLQTAARRRRNKYYFAAAMVKLRLRDPRAADVISDFNDYGLTADTDREDFQHNAAKVGTDEDNKMDDTVEFLWQLAQLPDHPTRELQLTALGFIGPRSVDMLEKAQAWLQSIRTSAGNMPDEVKDALRRLENSKALQNFEKSSKAAEAKAEQWLTDLRAQLKK